MKILFDTNVILDVLLAREPHAPIAAQLLSLVDTHELRGVLCATTITTIHYLASRSAGARKAGVYIAELLAMFSVAPVNEKILSGALELHFPDFEDAVLHQAAVASRCEAIVTRNRKDFTRATLPVYEPKELLAIALALRK